MNISQVYAVYFSATGNTRKVTTTLANALAVSFDVPLEVRDFTLPAAREEAYEFAAGDLVVFGMPTYAGKLPNKLLDFVKSGFHGNGALAVPVVTFGQPQLRQFACRALRLPRRGRLPHHRRGRLCLPPRLYRRACQRQTRFRRYGGACKASAPRSWAGIVRMTEYPAPVTVDGDADAPYYRPLGPRWRTKGVSEGEAQDRPRQVYPLRCVRLTLPDGLDQSR